MWYSHRTPALLQWFCPSLIWRLPGNGKSIYLTFDDGPVPEMTPLVLEILDQYQIKATFFCVGDNVNRHRPLFEEVIKAGHQIGNHTEHHLDGWRTHLSDYVENIRICDQRLHHNTGIKTLPLFRPPYGKITPRQIKQIKHSHRIVMWDVLSGDFDQKLSSEDCLQGTIGATRSGSIIIFHDNVKARDNLSYALPRYIRYCLKKGFEFNTL